jgi:glycogen debranching enzyme
MPDQLFAVDGTTFVLSRRSGDIDGITDGLWVRDARYLSRWVLTTSGQRFRLLTSHHVDHYSSLCVLTNPYTAELPTGALTVVRRRVVGGGMEEEIELTNHLGQALEFDLDLDVNVDFLDLFEMKAREFQDPNDQVFTGPNLRKVRREQGVTQGRPLVFSHEDRRYSGRMEIESHPAPDVADRVGLRWRLRLEPQETTKLVLRVRVVIQGHREPTTFTMADFGAQPEEVVRRFRSRGIVAPRLATSWSALQRLFQRSLRDLTALLIRDRALDVSLPAAGMPWFMTIFGRDTLLTSFQLLPNGNALAWGGLRMLAELQATEPDARRDAQPGRIMHELRRGPVAVNTNSFPYYGTIDAPLLFLILLHEVWLWSGDDAGVRALREPAEAILRWVDDFGDLDGDGFIEYLRRSPDGLVSQSWKDSWDSMRFHNGAVAEAPIATVEVQGYLYDAFLRTAELARGPWADPDLAGRLTARARSVYEQFNERFWSPARGGFYHLALDREKRPVDSKTSNMGHLLWSGIVPRDRAEAVVSQLMSPSLFSGWGIRTMSTEDQGFNPLSYHCGTVWAHDNSVAVAGLHRYGYHEEANRIFVAMVQAGDRFSEGRLPEEFSGYDRAISPFPVEYPTACIPQAWAAAAPVFMVREALRAQPDAERGLTVDPRLPRFVESLKVEGYLVAGQLYEVVVQGGRAEVNQVGSLHSMQTQPVTS